MAVNIRMTVRSGAAVLAWAGLASTAGAQNASTGEPAGSADPIGALIASTPSSPPPSPWAPTPATRPVFVDETGRTLESPQTPADRSYEARLRASFASAQGLQGPLDGHWTLSTADGAALYTFQLVDAGGAPLEGAWRDVRRAGALEASGFMSRVERIGSTLMLRFEPAPGGPTASAALSATDDGSWTGEFEDAGRRESVVMRRD